MSSFFAKILAFFMSILVWMGIIPADKLPDDGIKADATIVYTNDEAGSAAGTVSVTANYDGDYELYWGTASGDKLTVTAEDYTASYSEFATVSVKEGKGSAQLNRFLAIPDGAKTVLLYKGDELLETESVPENKVADNGEETYKFGALSDVHFNRYDDSSDDDASLAFPKALDFLDKFGVTMVGMSGDLSKGGEDSAYEKFNSITSKYDFPVFTVKGNHDCMADNFASWTANINPGVYSETKRAGVLSLAENGIDFTFSGPEANGDIFIFLSQSGCVYGPDARLLTDKQLDWLAGQLEEHKNERVYLFFHTFLTDEDAEEPFLSEGNIINKAGIFYPLVFLHNNPDEVRFRSLIKQYKNVIFFNGHSHWAYSMQKFSPQLNISDYRGTHATMVHVSSVTAPRTIGDYDPMYKSNAGTMSEGLLMTVYPERTVITACDFVSGEFLAYATYTVAK